MHKNHCQLIKNHFNQHANDVGSLKFIYEEIAHRLLTRLNCITFSPHTILDIGSGLNIDATLLDNKFPLSYQILKLDISINMLKQHSNREYCKSKPICGNGYYLPVKSNSVDLVWSNLTLPYVQDPNAFFEEILRVLSVGGTFLISGLSVDSLRQLRKAGLTTYNFPDMHLIGDTLLKLGFTDPVTDVDYITLEYNDIDQILEDIRLVGCGAANPKPKFLHKKDYLSIKDKFSQLKKNHAFPITLEVYFAHAWKDEAYINQKSGEKPIKFYTKK